MDVKFSAQVDKVVTLVRKRNLAALGKHELAKLKLVQQRLGARAELAGMYVGNVLKNLIIEVISSMKPSTPESMGEADWRYYILLRDYVVHGQPWLVVADRLLLGRTAFYDTRKSAIESLTLALWDLEQEALRRPLAVKHNLPRPPYVYFVRRSDENGKDYVDRIIGELSHPRVWTVSLVGTAGAGKTSLVYQVTQQCQDRELFDAIIWTSAKQESLTPEGIVALAHYTTSLDTILDTIGTTLGKREVLSMSRTEEKLAIIRELLLTINCLVVIDNLETLSEETVDRIFAFLKDLPGPSKALITSRKRHYSETIVTLPGMSAEEAPKFMRIEAEMRGLPPLSEEERRLIYQKTTGIPLAMQYAIGLMAVYGYSVEQAIEPGVPQDILLDYMFEGAYDKLAEREKKVLHVMPIFTDPTSAQAIGAVSSVKEAQLTVGLGRLYRLFLIEKIDRDCYEVLPAAQSFLESILRRDGLLVNGKPVSDFLVEGHRNLAKYYANRLGGMKIDDRLAFVRHEKRNVLSLMEWCYKNKEWQLVVDLVSEIGNPLGILGYWDKRMVWAKRAVEACDAIGDIECKAWFEIYDIGWTLIRRGEVKVAKRVIQKNLRLAEENGYERVEALALHNLGRLARDIGEYEEALELLERSLGLWSKLGEKDWIVSANGSLGVLKYKMGNLPEAQRHFEEALELRGEIGESGGIAQSLSNLAQVIFAQGDIERALELSDQSLFLAREIAKPAQSYAYALHRRVEIEEELGNVAMARKLAREAYETYKDLGAKDAAMKVEKVLERLTSKE